ncbi:MAG: type II toxin-antitoxin system ParD family antitoxin [Lamprobacter sp.]|uniref:type II toxin-antitoxin system ParD family antitoxin n=1 Tax=Lamprobacter sp. TaxID=3100796 RepID=UPI002B263007|nr:type II toxin-antitoxin system ParD family antitoxin [Lamprobacter sp.]MEA3642026.1 type II toxin-antitoxin system ParD family antitoxin [Lamprobacter sp.]
MATMNISLPDAMKAWVDECSRSGRYSNVSDYVRDLIRRDQERAAKIVHLQGLIDEALAAGEGRRSMEAIEAEALARLANVK